MVPMVRLAIAVLCVPVLASCSTPAKPTATLAAAAQTIGTSDTVSLLGALSSHKQGMPVALQLADGAAFHSAGVNGLTGPNGSYSLTFKPTASGPVTLRVEVSDGKKLVDSAAVQITVLAPTGLTLEPATVSEVAVAKNAALKGQVSPASAGRRIGLETSVDGTTWTKTATSVATNAAGAFSAPVTTTTAGQLRVRATVAATDKYAAATSAPVKLYFADYKGAGAKYLACVDPYNAEVDKLNKALDDYNSGNATFAQTQAEYLASAAANKAFNSCLKNYQWPPSVNNWVSDLQVQDAVVADYHSIFGHAKDITALNDAFDDAYKAASDAGSADAAKIRNGLGIAARKQ